MNNKAHLAGILYDILHIQDCNECPLQEVCELVEEESHNNNICRILESKRYTNKNL